MAEVKLEDIKPNSYKSKTQTQSNAPKATPVVSKDSVIATKKSLGQKFVDTFITEDKEDIKTWLIMDVVVPGIKNTILDMLSMMFFSGKTSGYNRGSRGRYYNSENVSYNSYYKSQYNRNRYSQRGQDDGPQMAQNGKVDYRNLVLKRRDDAERVVYEMQRRIADFGQVSIGDMLDLMEITGSYTDQNWGWHDARDIGIRRVSNGWLIDVAEAQPID